MVDLEGVFWEGESSEVTVKENVVTDIWAIELEVGTSVVLVSKMADSEGGASKGGGCGTGNGNFEFWKLLWRWKAKQKKPISEDTG